MQQQIIVLGSGATGSLIAAYLAAADYNVLLLDAPSDRLDRLATEGIRVGGVRGDFSVRVPVKPLTELSSSPAPEFVLLCVHPNDMADRVRLLVDAFGSSFTLVPFMSGMAPFALRNLVDESVSLGAVANFECKLLRDGTVETDFHNFIWLGEYTGVPSERIQKLQIILSHVAPTFLTKVIDGMIWSKAIYSVEVTMSALADASPSSVFSQQRYRKLAASLVRENIALAEAAGVTPIAFDFFDPNLYLAENSKQAVVTDTWIKNAWIRHEQFRVGLEHPFADQVGLSWQMSPANQLQEATSLLSALLAESKRVDCPLPLTTRLADIHGRVVAGQLQAGWENLELLEVFRNEASISIPYPGN